MSASLPSLKEACKSAATAAKQRIHCRWMIRRDMVETLAIAVEHMTGWDEEEFLVAMRQRDVIGKVAETGEAITGNLVYRLGAGSLEVLYLAGDDDSQRALLANLTGSMRDDRKRITFSVPEWYVERQLFLRDGGYVGAVDGDCITFTYSLENAHVAL